MQADATVTAAGNNTGTAGEIRLFILAPESIHSDQIKDTVNGKSGNVFFATTFGLSEYNGTWSTRHVTRDNTSEGLIDDYITAIEFDPDGNLWIGYPKGIQIFNGATYQTIRDQQLLKDPRINALQRWGDTMWIATGNAGIHRFRNGTWTWFQPRSKGGPGFYEVDSMAVDPQSGLLLVATAKEGVWMVNSSTDPVGFERIDSVTEVPVPTRSVRQNPLGGAYFFDRQTVTSFSPATGWKPVLSAADLAIKPMVINDVAAGQDGSLYIGTDDGLYIWHEGAVARRLGRYEGIGTSMNVRWIFADVKDRVWFATQGSVGYYAAGDSSLPPIPIRIVNQTPTGPATTVPTPVLSPTPAGTTTVPAETVTGGNTEPSLLERLIEFFSGILEKLRGSPGGAG